jgi:hypothetical protein
MSIRAVARELNVHFSTINRLQCCFRELASVRPTSLATTDHVYGIVWVSCLLMSMLWTECPAEAVGFGVGRHKLRTQLRFIDSNFNAEIPWRDPEAHCCAFHPLSSPSFTMIMHGPILQGSVHNSWKLIISSSSMACILTRHVTRWARLGCPGSTCTTQHVPVPANIQQLRTAIEEWGNIPQATISSLINSMRRRCVTLHEASGGHTRYWLVFWSTPLPLF